MANAMYEYATAYNLAKEINTELAIDVSEYDVSIWPYMLDYFKIPEVKKVQYPIKLSKRSHGKTEGIKNYFSKEPIILVENSEGVKGNVIEYKSLSDVASDKIPSNKDLYLNDYFFAKRYNRKYWSEVIKQFEAREDFAEIKIFEQFTRKKEIVSVGIHIRRGDMLFAPWAKKMTDEYYCAGIAWFRKHFKGCEFFIFTDDKQYVRELFGEQNDVHYVNVLGFEEADLIEFICLSKCEHFILSNSSTYSRLASEICTNEDRVIIRKKEASGLMWTDEAIHRFYYLKNRYKKGKREVELSDVDICQYYKVYCKQLSKYREKEDSLVNMEWDNKQNPNDVLNTIAYYSVINGFKDNEERVKMLKRKMLALYEMKRYDRFIELSYVAYSYYANQNWFREKLINALIEEGYEEEAELERRWSEDRNAIVFIFGSNQENIYSINTMEMQYADIFGHMGYESHYVVRTDDRTSLSYIRNSEGKLFTNAASVKTMYFIHSVDEFASINATMKNEKDRIAIVRTLDDFELASGMRRVFVDYSDNNDYLHDMGEKMSKEDLAWMYDNADYIMSSDDNVFDKYSEKTIEMRTLTQIIEERTHYKWGHFHRMKLEYIYNVNAIVEKLHL